MKGKKFNQLFCVMLSLLMVLSPLVFGSAESVTSSGISRSHEIAVVFDNSAAMYSGDKWCQAKYALEVLASMLNYDAGDHLTIYPMWSVSSSKKVAEKSGGVYPVGIGSVSGIESLSYLYTPGDDGDFAPFEPVNEAFSALKASKSDEKWLFIMMAGAFNADTRADGVGNEFEAKKVYDLLTDLKEKVCSTVQIEYFKIGKPETDNQDMTSIANGKTFFFDKANESSDTTDLMINVCNRILQRKELNSSFIGKESVDINVTMSNMYIYIPNKKTIFTSISNEESEELIPVSDTDGKEYKLKSSLSTYSHGKLKSKCKVDRDLYGRILSYKDIKIGTYPIVYEGDIRIFYEPGIEIQVNISTDSKGLNIIDPDFNGQLNAIEAGTYYVFYALIDSGTGKDVSKSSLIKLNGITATKVAVVDGEKRNGTEIKGSGTKFTIKEGETIFFDVTAKYSDRYVQKTSYNSKRYTYLGTIPSNMSISATNGQDYYVKGSVEKWKPITVTITLDGNPLSSDLMNACEFSIENDSIQCSFEKDIEKSQIIVYPGKSSNGDYLSPSAGRYPLKFRITCLDAESGISASKFCTSIVEITDYPKWLPFVLAGALLLILIILFLIFGLKPLVNLIKNRNVKKYKKVKSKF